MCVCIYILYVFVSVFLDVSSKFDSPKHQVWLMTTTIMVVNPTTQGERKIVHATSHQHNQHWTRMTITYYIRWRSYSLPSSMNFQPPSHFCEFPVSCVWSLSHYYAFLVCGPLWISNNFIGSCVWSPSHILWVSSMFPMKCGCVWSLGHFFVNLQ